MIALGIDAGVNEVCVACSDATRSPFTARDIRQAWQLGTDRFGDLQGAVIATAAGGRPGARRGLLRAARQADFEVLRVSSAPAAAALGYALDSGAQGIYAVLDLRRGAFDCSLVAIDARRVEVLATVGFADLGADAVDQALTDVLGEEAGATPRDLSTVRARARRAREALGDQFDVRIELRLPSGGRLDRRLSRHQMAHYSHRVRHHWMKACRQAIAEALTRPAWIDGVITLGNASMLSKVVRECFNRPSIRLGAEGAARGAARYASVLMEGTGPLILERSTHGLALEARDGSRRPVLSTGVPLPASVPCRPDRGDRLVHLDWRDEVVAVEAIEPAVSRLQLDANGVVHAR